MSTKTAVWISVLVFSIVGGYIPVFFGASAISLWSLVGSTIGGIFGIWVGMKIGN